MWRKVNVLTGRAKKPRMPTLEPPGAPPAFTDDAKASALRDHYRSVARDKTHPHFDDAFYAEAKRYLAEHSADVAPVPPPRSRRKGRDTIATSTWRT